MNHLTSQSMIVNHVVSCQYVCADRSCESHIVELQVNDTFDIFLRCLATGKSDIYIEFTIFRARQSRERKKTAWSANTVQIFTFLTVCAISLLF